MDTIIIIGMISICAISGRAVVMIIFATSVVIIIVASAIVDVAMIPRPPESPTRLARRAGKSSAVTPRPRRSRQT
eukprot:3160455-Pyramimonas_sp.AAC.1